MWYFIWTLFWPEQRAVDLMQVWGGGCCLRTSALLIYQNNECEVSRHCLSLNICLLLKKNSPRNAFRVSSLVVIIPLGSIFLFIQINTTLRTCYRRIIQHMCSWKHKNHQLPTGSMMGYSMIPSWLKWKKHPQFHQVSSRWNRQVGRFHPQISQLNTVLLLLVWGSSTVSF